MPKPKTPAKPYVAPASSEAAALPARIQLVRPHSFIDADARHRVWLPGHTVTNPDDIALLIARKVDYVEHD